MYKHLLIATDGSELASGALRRGLQLAGALKSMVTVITVTEPWSAVAVGEMALAFPPAEYDKTTAANASAILAEARKMAESAGVACDTLQVKDQHPAEGIVATAKSRGCDLIVMASHGRRGIRRFLLGSQAQRVVTQGDVPVLVYR